jgi:raffinose synthase
VLPDGNILRTILPARPTVDTMFKNVMTDGETALKIWSMNSLNAVVGVFNLQGAYWSRKSRKYVFKGE